MEPLDRDASLLPLRMIAEWVYCPRLFHYMHVEGLMVANEHVWRGRFRHRRLDTPGREQPRRRALPEREATAGESVDAEGASDRPAAWANARAVALSSPELGITGKLDVVLLSGDGTAIPTETKSGLAPGDSPHVTLAPGVWDSDAIQVTLQALLLEASGHRVPWAEVYYAASRQLIRVELGPLVRERALAAIAGARDAQNVREHPAPLVDSPKCRGCSLVEVCLPEESRLLREVLPVDDELGDSPPPIQRRLVASRPEGRSVTVSRPGSSIRKEQEALAIAPPPGEEGEIVRVPLDSIDNLALLGSVHASTSAILACLERGIPVSFHAASGRLLGLVTAGLANNVALRMRQHEAASDGARTLAIAREVVRGKLRNQRTLVRRNGEIPDEIANEWASLLRGVDDAGDLDTLRGVEGRFARRYFELLSGVLEARGGETFRMQGRSRRPPTDPANALLSFGYAILAREVASVVARVGFDPMRGFLHGPGWGRPALALDLMEEFRPLVVDSVVLRIVAEKRLGPDDFHRELQGVALTPAARRTFLRALDQRLDDEVRHPVFGYHVSYRRALELQARVLARVLEGEAERYISLTTR